MPLSSVSRLLQQTPVFVAGAYAIIASLWIFFSDRALAALVSDPGRLTQLQTYKGWFFVAATTALLAWLIQWRQRALNELNATLEHRVKARTEALSQANQALAGTLEDLRQTQDELVRSEKLAALGALVAGVAHELNTPIGNSLMVASSFAEDSDKLLTEFSGGSLRKSALEKYVNEAQEASELLVRNLGKAADLVNSFKQVAVDRTSSRRREFKLAEVVNEILVTLRPGFKRLPIKVEAAVAESISLDSYPGPLGQVLSNLIENAIIHGFEGGQAGGRVEISASELPGDEIELIISDNGKGIPVGDQGRVFDPFFTTRFGHGGSGLGLHIVHHLVTQVLGGSIKVRSGGDTFAEVGTEVIVRLPKCPAEPTAPLAPAVRPA
jgi:signal transduction histidine kinase